MRSPFPDVLMSREIDTIAAALERWVGLGLLDADTADKLRAETEAHTGSSTRRLSQYLIAAAAGAATLIAGGVFLDFAWDLLDRPGRAFLLGVMGCGTLLGGMRLEGGSRWRPAAYLMQTAGLGLLLGAAIYSDSVWDDQTVIGSLIGLAALVPPIVLAPRAMRRNAVMPAVHLVAGIGFLAVFLDKVTSLSGDSILWILDVTLLGAIAVLTGLLRSDPEGQRHPWVLNAFVMALFGGFFLVMWTGLEVLSLSDDVLYPLDLWLFMCAALTVWGIRSSPPGQRREWFGTLLSALALLWIPFGFATAYETSGGSEEILAFALVGGGGVAGFLFGRAREIRPLMGVGTVSFILALWVLAADLGGALGVFMALVATAGGLFWLSGRMGSDGDDA